MAANQRIICSVLSNISTLLRLTSKDCSEIQITNAWSFVSVANSKQIFFFDNNTIIANQNTALDIFERLYPPKSEKLKTINIEGT